MPIIIDAKNEKFFIMTHGPYLEHSEQRLPEVIKVTTRFLLGIGEVETAAEELHPKKSKDEDEEKEQEKQAGDRAHTVE